MWKCGFVEWFSIQKYSGSRISVQPEEGQCYPMGLSASLINLNLNTRGQLLPYWTEHMWTKSLGLNKDGR